MIGCPISRSLAGIRLAVPDHTLGLPVLPALALRTCCCHDPGAAPGRTLRSLTQTYQPAPKGSSASACTSSFSRLARQSLALRPAHSRCHQFVTRLYRRLQPFRRLHDCSGCFRLERWPGGACTRWKSAALPRRTPNSDIWEMRSVSVRHAGNGDFTYPRKAPGVASARFPVSSIYGFGVGRRAYDAFGWKAHGDRGADTDLTLQVQVTAVHLDKRLG